MHSMGGVERSETVEETYAWSGRHMRRRLTIINDSTRFAVDPQCVMFSELKTKVRVYSGISKENRKKLLDELMKRHY